MEFLRQIANSVAKVAAKVAKATVVLATFATHAPGSVVTWFLPRDGVPESAFVGTTLWAGDNRSRPCLPKQIE